MTLNSSIMKVYILATLSLLLKWSYQTYVQEYSVRIDTFNDIKVDEYLLWSEQGLTTLYCVVQCARDPRCHSFQVEDTTGTCRGHSTSFASPSKLYSPTETVSGFQMFLMQSAANYIGDACIKNGDCHVTNAMCYDGICICRLGYLFSPSDLACTTDCDEWSDDFTRYIGTGGWDNTNTTILGITEAECRRRCVEAYDSSFICVTADYEISPQICSFGYEPYAIEEEQRNDFEWAYYQRNCDL